MIKFLSDAGYVAYTEIAKPLVFRLKADTVHESMVTSGAAIQQIPFFMDATRATLRHDDPILETTVAGVPFKNPLGLSAGLDKDAKLLRIMEAVGFGFEECGSVTLHPYEGNPQPWYTRLPKSRSIVVNSGLRSEGAAAVIRRMKAQYDDSFLQTFPMNVSVAKTNTKATATTQGAIEDYCGTLQQLESYGKARLYTLNISCPNTYGGEPFTTPELLRELLDGVQAVQVTKPVCLKLPIDKSWEESRKLLQVAAQYDFIKVVTLGNLYKDRASAKLLDPLPDSLAGNLSGKPCWEASNALLAASYREFGDRFAFSGVGGVFTAQDAYHKIRLGASLVEMVTGLIFQGPSVVGRITSGLADLLRRDGFSSVAEAVGVDNNKQ